MELTPMLLATAIHLLQPLSAQPEPILSSIFTQSAPCVISICNNNPCDTFAAWYQAVGIMPYCSGHPNTQCVTVQPCNANCYAQYVDLITGQSIDEKDCQIVYSYTASPPVTPTTPAPVVAVSTNPNANPVQTTTTSTTTTTTATPTAQPTSPVTVQVFFDAMSNVDHWQLSSPSHIAVVSSTAYCNSADCIRVSGYNRQDTFIARSTPNNYASYTLTLDVILINMESTDYCEIYSKFGDNGAWQQLGSFVGRVGERLKFTESTFDFPNSDASASLLYIKLETNGGSTTGRDYCYFDNVYLYGTGNAVAAGNAHSVAAAAVAGKKGYDPMENEVVNQELLTAQTKFAKYFSLESTAGILIWISLLSVWCIICTLLCWCQKLQSQSKSSDASADTAELNGCETAEDSILEEELEDILPDKFTPPLPEDV